MTGWVFDLDGTLTIAVHDFASMKRRLGLAADQPLMEGLNALPDGARAAAWQAVEDWELELAEVARPAVGAVALLSSLQEQGVALGVLTRNTREVALRTLEVTGLQRWFDPAHVLGRRCCAPKPDPAGVLHLSRVWSIPPDALVMVGDSEIDIGAGRAAGARTIRVSRGGSTEATLHVSSLSDVRATPFD